ncbi:MAG: hypothetical protein ACRBHB_09080 [Arenicella sp.]
MNKIDKSRRKLLNTSLVTGGVYVTSTSEWSRPIINSVLLPAHAQTSCSSNASLSGPISGTARALLSAPNAGTITICASDLGFQTGTFTNPGLITEQVINYAFNGCTGSATLNGSVAGGTASGTFTYILSCPSGSCQGSGTWSGTNTIATPLLYVGTWSGTQTCCGDPEFVIGRDAVPFVCPF